MERRLLKRAAESPVQGASLASPVALAPDGFIVGTRARLKPPRYGATPAEAG